MGGLTAAMLAGSCSAKGRIENDYYATPYHATKAILNEIDLGTDSILEPSAGEGHIVKVLREYYPNNEIVANDLIDRHSRIGIEINSGIDFLTYEPDRKFGTIITNPPFKFAQQFVEHSLELASHYVIMFCNLLPRLGERRRCRDADLPMHHRRVVRRDHIHDKAVSGR